MDAVRRLAGCLRLLPAVLLGAGCATDAANQAAPDVSALREKAGFHADVAGRATTARPQAPIDPPGPVAAPAAVPPVAATPVSAPNVSGVVQAGGPSPGQGTTQVRVVALIGSDVVITDDEVWQMVRQKARDYVHLTGAERDRKERDVFQEELRQLIDRELVLADFLGKIKKHKPQVLDELKEEAARMADRQIREVRKRLEKEQGLTTEAQFHKALQDGGMSLKAMRRHLERNYMMQVYVQQHMKDKGKPTTVSLALVRRYYDEHPDEFKVEDRVKWQHLFVSYARFNTPDEARQYAEGLHRQAAGGADFAKLVKEHGHGDSPLRGGDGLGQKPGEIAPRELEPEVFRLTPGQVSGLIPTATGLHVVKVLERDEAGVRPFDEKTQTAIRNRLTAQVQKAEYEKLIEDLWRRTTVKVVDEP